MSVTVTSGVVWLWVAMFIAVVVACAAGLYFTTNVREPEEAMKHARNTFLTGVIIGSLGALWIAWEAL